MKFEFAPFVMSRGCLFPNKLRLVSAEKSRDGDDMRHCCFAPRKTKRGIKREFFGHGEKSRSDPLSPGRPGSSALGTPSWFPSPVARPAPGRAHSPGPCLPCFCKTRAAQLLPKLCWVPCLSGGKQAHPCPVKDARKAPRQQKTPRREGPPIFSAPQPLFLRVDQT